MQDVREQVRVHIRWMIRRDMKEVMAIEWGNYGLKPPEKEDDSTDSQATDPWHEVDILRCLRQRNCIGMVSEQGEKVVGYMIYDLCKTSFNLHRMVVDPTERRKHIGSQMISKLKGKLSPYRRARITTTVRETNLSTLLFFKSQQFEGVKLLRGWYDDTGEDAILMEYTLSE